MADAPAAPVAPAEAAPAPTETPAPAAAPPAEPIRIFKSVEELYPEPPAEPPPDEEPQPEPPPAAAAPPEPKPEPVVAKGLALLTKREAEARKRDEAIKAREEALAAREAKLKSDDPIAVLEAHGFTYEQATEFVINGKKPTAEMIAAAEAKKTKDTVARLEAAEAQREAAYKRELAAKAAESFKGAIKDITATNADKFECINTAPNGRGVDMVFDVVDAHWAQTGQLLGADSDDPRAGTQEYAIELAAEQVEKYLEEMTAPLLTTKKFQNKIQASREVRPTATPASKQPARTLSHSQAATVPPRAPVKFTTPDETIEQLLSSGLKIFKPD